MKRADTGTTLTRSGWRCIRPTVPTWWPPMSSAIRRTSTASAAATYPASWRWSIGVVPAWLDWPVTVSSCQEIPWTPVTAPIVIPSASSTGPCSMCSSTYAAGVRLGHGSGPA